MEATLKTIVIYCFWHLLIIHYCSIGFCIVCSWIISFCADNYVSGFNFFWFCSFSPTSWKLFDDGQTASGIEGSWCKQVNTANQMNRDCSNETFLRRANSMYNLYHILYSEAQPDSVGAQLIQLISECLTHSKNQTRVRMHSLHSGKKRKESSPETQNMCIFCLRCMISVKKKDL